MPALEITLHAGESIVSEADELPWMSSAINMHTSTQKAGGGEGSARSHVVVGIGGAVLGNLCGGNHDS